MPDRPPPPTSEFRHSVGGDVVPCPLEGFADFEVGFPVEIGGFDVTDAVRVGGGQAEEVGGEGVVALYLPGAVRVMVVMSMMRVMMRVMMKMMTMMRVDEGDDDDDDTNSDTDDDYDGNDIEGHDDEIKYEDNER